MKFVSTRGNTKWSFEEALFCCYTSDGGLLMPESIPQVSVETLKKWKELSYVELVKQILPLFISSDEVPIQKQSELLDKAFAKFDTKKVVDVVHLKDGLNILELWHGDTLTFKDLAMSCTSEFLNYFLEKRNQHFIAVVVTSGDTGSSAMYAVQNVTNMDLIVLYPHNRISALQEIMMTAVDSKNIHLYAADGSSDDIDVAASRVLFDTAFVTKHNVGTMNSMNLCRILVQIAHHIYAYLQMAEEIGSPVNIIIPCGGCGNIAACMTAREMGVPIAPTAVCNKNNSFHRMLRTNERVVIDVDVSKAPAMDISFARNIERIIWLVSGKNTEVVIKVMNELAKMNKSHLPENYYKKMSDSIRSSFATDDVIIEAMKRCWKENEYHICPHTATAVGHYYGVTQGSEKGECKNVPTICVATASAAKFFEVLVEAGLPECKSEKIERLKDLPQRAVYLDKGQDWEKIIREKILEISA